MEDSIPELTSGEMQNLPSRSPYRVKSPFLAGWLGCLLKSMQAEGHPSSLLPSRHNVARLTTVR